MDFIGAWGFTVPSAEVDMWVEDGDTPVQGRLSLDTSFPVAVRESHLLLYVCVWGTQRELLETFSDNSYFSTTS